LRRLAREPGLSEAVSHYSFAKLGDPKEAVWEGVRRQSFAHLPSRLKSFYCFENIDLADRAAKEWFGNESRTPLELRITTAAVMHRCDAKLLETTADDWPGSADRYWKGEMTNQPFPEIIVDGPVYFPGWEQFPIGF
jgi:hypothetical protein